MVIPVGDSSRGQLLLPEVLKTEPGAPPRLYLDATISVQGLLEPVCPLSTCLLQLSARHVMREAFGSDPTEDLDRTVPIVAAGRILLHVSNLVAVAGRTPVLRFFEQLDPLAAAALSHLDETAWRSARLGRADLVPGFATRLPRHLSTALGGRLRPARARDHLDRAIAKWRTRLDALERERLAPTVFADRVIEDTVQLILREVLPRLAVARRAVGALEALLQDAGLPAALLDDLQRALPGSRTLELAVRLDALADTLPDPAPTDVPTLAAALRDQALPDAFLRAWAALLRDHGHRGRRELDLREPRAREDPSVLLGQLLALSSVEAAHRPTARLEAGRAARTGAVQALEGGLGWVGWQRARSQLAVLESLGGVRETHESLAIEAFDRIRSRVLALAAPLVAAGRLDPGQVFDLHLEDLERAEANPELDLRARAAARRHPHDLLAGGRPLPRVFDSLGRVVGPPPAPEPQGVLVGRPSSAGVAVGRVRVAAALDEPLQPGEILVAQAVDPGWTPLLLGAAALVLELGGKQQHGGLVARELGVPCVAAIPEVAVRLRDGQLVEVDGTHGVVRIRPG